MKILKRSKSSIIVIVTLISVIDCTFLFMDINEYQVFGFFLFSLIMCVWCIYFLAKAQSTEWASFHIATILCSLIVGANCYIRIARYFVREEVSIAISIIVCIVAVLVVFPLYKKYQRKEDIVSPEVGMTYKNYKTFCRSAWFKTLSENVNNKAAYIKVFRIAIMSFCIFCGSFMFIRISMQAISFFDVCNNAFLYLSLMLFGAVYFYSGLVYALIISGFVFATLFGSKIFSLYLCSRFTSTEFYPFASFVTCFLALFGTFSFVLWLIVRWELFYSNVQVFERNNDSIAIDLLLAECKPIAGLNQLAAFRVPFDDLKDLIRFLRITLNACHNTNSVLAGYFSDASTSQIVFYAYSQDSIELKKRLFQSAKRIRLEIEGYETTFDPNWEKYDSLFPNDIEMATLKNRNQIEELYHKGIDSNTQYELSFSVGFEDKNKPALFEKEVEHLGMCLAIASFLESDCGYFCEYRITTYVTLRRVEYLTSSLKSLAGSFGAMYDGNWKIDKNSHQY